MDLDVALAHLRRNSHAVLCTVRESGVPQMSPVLVAVDDDGWVLVSTSSTSAKAANLRRDPRAWLCVFPDTFFGDWVQLEVHAEVVPVPEALDGLVDYYRAVSGEHPDWQAYREAMVEDGRVLLRLDPVSAGPG